MNETYFHLAAYFASLTNGSTNVAVAAVQDNVLTKTTSNNFTLPKQLQMRAMYSAGAFLTRARINTPSLRYVGLPYVGPVNNALVVPSPANITDYGDNGPILPTVDEISVEHSLLGAAPENEFSLVWLNDGKRMQAGQAEYRIRYTGTITCVAGTWVAGSMTPDQTLPNGRYQIVGMDAIGLNLAAARLVFPGGGWRPGCLARNAANLIPYSLFTSGMLGVYGTFDTIALPALECFSIGACTAQEVYLDLIRTGPHS